MMKTKTNILYPVLTVFALVCCAFVQNAPAVSPPPDGGYPGGNTAEGQSALLSLTTGGFNTAVGFFSLRSDTTGQFNTAIGAGTLLANTADQNTATGAGALLSNPTGSQNTACGSFALSANTTGAFNTAVGSQALLRNTVGTDNVAIGTTALSNNTQGSFNTAVGENALFFNTTGVDNVALGISAGTNVITADHVICIGANVQGEDVSATCYIGNIFGRTSAGGTAVFVNSSGKLGTATSSRRFKEDVKPMHEASRALFALKPVTFRYKKDIDPAATSQFGLVAEDVEKVNPDLIVRDEQGKPYSVRYEQVNAMLLNEFLKEHRRVQELASAVAKQEGTIAQQQRDFQLAIARQRTDFKATAAQQQKQIQVLTSSLTQQAAKIQEVSAQLELSKPAPQTVLNNH